ncbi:MAG TPA: ZIP family metal transporter [Phycisphaerales bacterium]|nr:ZIP family metal transporter [Phycisphaerales bacterium]
MGIAGSVLGMSLTVMTAVYCGLILCASALGGWLPTTVRMTHKRMEVALSFVAGMMLGIGLLHMLPHALIARMEAGEGVHAEAHELVEPVVMWVLGGFLVMFLLQRFFEFHHHEEVETSDESPTVCAGQSHTHAHTHGHDHDEVHGHTHEHAAHGDPMSAVMGGAKEVKGKTRWMAATAGMGVHSLLEGVALSAAMASHTVDGSSTARMWTGLGVFLVIVLHKPFDAMTLTTLMLQAGKNTSAMILMSVGLGLIVMLGAVLFNAGVTASGESGWLVSAALGLSAGSFLYISLSDLLPELQFHSHDRWKLTGALLLGLGLAWGISRLEAMTHEHEEEAHQMELQRH